MSHSKFATTLVHIPLPQAITVEHEPVPVIYGLPSTYSIADRATILAGWLMFDPPQDYTAYRCGLWFWTAIELSFPGVAAAIFHAAYGQAITVNALPIVTQQLLLNGEGEPLDVLPDVTGDEVSRRGGAPLEEAIGALAVLIFSLGKRPSARNILAFTSNRPRAIGQRSGLTIGADSPLGPTRIANANLMNRINGYFNDRLSLRSVFIKYLINWTVTDVGPKQAIVAAQLNLWKMAGMEHANHVRDLLVSYYEQVEQMRGLRGELIKYEKYFDDYLEEKDEYKSYDRVIHADRSRYFPLKEYDHLALLAASVLRRTNVTLRNYRDGMVSPYLKQFEKICEADSVELPDEAIAPTRAAPPLPGFPHVHPAPVVPTPEPIVADDAEESDNEDQQDA